jgi:hypothetical protein
LSTPTRSIVRFQDFDTLVLFPSLDSNTAAIDAHDPSLYTLVISYDPAPTPPPAGGGAGLLPSDALFAETGGEGGMAQPLAAPVSNAMLVDLLTATAVRTSSQSASSLDHLWAASMTGTLATPVL